MRLNIITTLSLSLSHAQLIFFLIIIILLFLSFPPFSLTCTPLINVNKIIILVRKLPLKKKKKTYTYQTHNYIFSHFKICCFKHGAKNIFFLYEYFKYIFSQYFLNYNFRIILNKKNLKDYQTGSEFLDWNVLVFLETLKGNHQSHVWNKDGWRINHSAILKISNKYKACGIK